MRGLRLLLALFVLPLSALGAQHDHARDTLVNDDDPASRFVAEAISATTRYRDRSVAIADGYRQVGPELPAMGEHWLNIALVLADTLDAAHPPVLIYVQSPNGPVLAGAAYTRLLGPGDRYPDFPHGLHAWHDHTGFVEDEALPTMHNGRAATHVGDGMRLGILHLWMGVRNPSGEWTADNWALPFVRAGMRAPEQSERAARALALASDSGRYYLGVLTKVGKLDSSEVDRARAIFDGAVQELSELRLRSGTPLTTDDVARMSAIWTALGVRLSRELPAGALREVSALWW